MSDETVAELRQTLNKEKLRKYLSEISINTFIKQLLLITETSLITQHVKQCCDPKDDKFLELALSGKADCLITGDKDLLILNPFKNIPIISPSDFLNNY